MIRAYLHWHIFGSLSNFPLSSSWSLKEKCDLSSYGTHQYNEIDVWSYEWINKLMTSPVFNVANPQIKLQLCHPWWGYQAATVNKMQLLNVFASVNRLHGYVFNDTSCNLTDSLSNTPIAWAVCKVQMRFRYVICIIYVAIQNVYLCQM